MFAEFIEAHVNDKTAWIKEAFENAANSDEDSGVEEEKPSATSTSTEEVKEVESPKKEEKVANKQISDLEVIFFYFELIYLVLHPNGIIFFCGKIFLVLA